MVTGAILVVVGIVFLVAEVFYLRTSFSHEGAIDPESLKILLQATKPEAQKILLEGPRSKDFLTIKVCWINTHTCRRLPRGYRLCGGAPVETESI